MGVLLIIGRDRVSEDEQLILIEPIVHVALDHDVIDETCHIVDVYRFDDVYFCLKYPFFMGKWKDLCQS